MSLNRYFAVQYVIDMPGASAAKYSARNARKITSAVENIVLDVSDVYLRLIINLDDIPQQVTESK